MGSSGRLSVLVVDDDEQMASLVAHGLEQAGHDARVFIDGMAGLEGARDPSLDVIVVDVHTPGPDGLSLVKSLRHRRDARPVLLTGRADAADRVEILNAGADDYLLKPFALDELVARVEALARRGRHEVLPTLHSAGVTLDPVARSASRDGRRLELTPREFDLLEFFLRNPNQALSSRGLRDRVWPEEEEDGVGSNVVAVYVGYLRAKVDTPFGRHSIRTVRGSGYRWDPTS